MEKNRKSVKRVENYEKEMVEKDRNESIEKKIEKKMRDVNRRFEKLMERKVKSGEILEEVNYEINVL